MDVRDIANRFRAQDESAREAALQIQEQEKQGREQRARIDNAMGDSWPNEMDMLFKLVDQRINALNAAVSAEHTARHTRVGRERATIRSVKRANVCYLIGGAGDPTMQDLSVYRFEAGRNIPTWIDDDEIPFDRFFLKLVFDATGEPSVSWYEDRACQRPVTVEQIAECCVDAYAP